MCAHILCVFLYQLTQTVLCDRNPGMLKTLQVRLRATYCNGLGKRGHIVADTLLPTMCLQQCVLVCQGLNAT